MSSKKTYHHRINAQNIDFRKKISLVSLVNLVLGAAGNNADVNGFGVLDLMSKNHSWVLSRLVIDMNQIPVENEDIAIETWLQKSSQAFSLRNFRFLGNGDKIMGYGASTWAIINLETRRPIPLSGIETLNRNFYNESTPIGEPQRLPDVNGEVLNTFRVLVLTVYSLSKRNANLAILPPFPFMPLLPDWLSVVAGLENIRSS